MRRTILTLLSFVGAAGLVAGLVSCGGGGTSNDQGVSFTLLGFFEALPEDQCQPLDPFVSRVSTTISDTENTESAGSGGVVTTIAAMQNNLSGQFVRSQRAELSFFIPGASVQPPSTNVGAGAVISPLAPPGADAGGGFDSSLPPSFGADDCNRGYTTIAVVPADIRAWVNLNRNSLPEAPFPMVVDVTISGVTSAGDHIDSNTAEIFVEFLPDNLIDPTAGGGAA